MQHIERWDFVAVGFFRYEWKLLENNGKKKKKTILDVFQS